MGSISGVFAFLIIFSLSLGIGFSILLLITREKKRLLEQQLQDKELTITNLRQALELKEEKKQETAVLQEQLMDGLVMKKLNDVGGRKTTMYSLTDKWPTFESTEKLEKFAEQMLNKVEDPFVAELEPYGWLTTVDQYMALKLVAQALVKELVERRKKEATPSA